MLNMNVNIYLAVCVLSCVYALPDQTWTTISKLQQNMEKGFTEMEHRMLEMAKKVETVDQKYEQVLRENLELTSQIQELRSAVASTPLISFSAIMTSGQFVSVPEGENIIPFDVAVSNPGSHYDVTTYKFKCPTDGMYFFTFSLYSGVLQDGTGYEICSGRLVMDDTYITSAYGRAYDANIAEEMQVSNSAVVLCAQDSEVYVTAPHDNTGIWGSKGYTAFSGFIL